MKITTAKSIYSKIERPDELSEISPEAIERAVPTVINVRIDSSEVLSIACRIKSVGELRARSDAL